MLRWLLRRLAYPVLTGGSVLVVWLAIGAKVPLFFVAVGLTVASVALIIGLERVIPYSARWAAFQEDERIDPIHFLLSERAYDLGALLTLFLLAPLGDWVHRLGVSIWPRTAPLAVQVVLAMLLSDLALYWGHRLGHTSPWLWRLHAVHHTSPRLHWLSVWRSHPLDNILRSAANVAPLAFCGVPPEVMALMAAFSGMSVILSHSNADLLTGPLDLLFNTPTVHRWHHSRRPDEAQANYAPVLALWDHVFRTRRVPRGHLPSDDVGLTEDLPGLPVSYLAQLRAPFQPERWAPADAPRRTRGLRAARCRRSGRIWRARSRRRAGARASRSGSGSAGCPWRSG